MKYLLLLLVLFCQSCSVFRKANKTVSTVDSTATRIIQVGRSSSETSTKEQAWQQFKLGGSDTIVRLSDLRIENSIIPAIPQFIQGSDRYIYLPTDRTILTRDSRLDSLVIENARLIATLNTRSRETEKALPVSISRLLWAVVAVAALWVVIEIIKALRNTIHPKNHES